MKKIISIIFLIILVLGIYSFYIKNTENNIKAIKGVIDFNNYDFTKEGIVKLEGEWELYDNKLLSPEELEHESTNNYLTIPTQLSSESMRYMTLRLRISAPEDIVYGFRIKNLLSASKVWVNGVLQGGAGKVGTSNEDERALYSPVYSYFTSKNGIVDIVIQTSDFKEIYPVIKSMEFGLKDKIMNQSLLDAGIDLIIIGALLIAEMLFLTLYKHVRNEKSYLYFSILCLFIQLRCLFLNERIIVHFFPNMPFELLSKTAALTYYLWIPVYVLFLKEVFCNMPKKLILISSVFSITFSIICFVTNNTFYDKLGYLSQFILFIILVYILIFLIKKVKKRERNSHISFAAFLFLVVTCINDILVNNGFSYARYGFQIGMFIFVFLQTYALAINYSHQKSKLEKLEKQNEKIYENSIRDGLTKLYNRNYIETLLDNFIENYKVSKEKFTVFMFDIDRFKLINDNYGHLCGDKVLSTVSNVIVKTLRGTDYIGRYGGDEFIVIFPNTKIDNAKEIAERVRYNIENLSWEEEFKITISGGLYEINTNIKCECLKAVDDLLYLAKENGRNRVEIDINQDKILQK